LAKRLTQQGVVLSGGLLAGVLSEKAVSACVPTSLVASTVKAGSLLVAGQVTAAGVISAQGIVLMEGVLKAMLMTKLKTVTALLLVAAAVGLGGSVLSRSTTAAAQTAGERLSKAAGEQRGDQPPSKVSVQQRRTGSLMVGVGVNSDAGLTGGIVLNERNFDIMRIPRSFEDLVSGNAFRGAGQEFRLEAVPGTRPSQRGGTKQEEKERLRGDDQIAATVNGEAILNEEVYATAFQAL
jgi:outer membrane protein assembly factor BamA